MDYNIFLWIYSIANLSCSEYKHSALIFGLSIMLLYIDRGLVPHSEIQVSKEKNYTFLPRSLVKIQYCVEPPWPRGCVLGLKPPEFDFWITCPKRAVSSHSSHHPQEVPGPVKPIIYVHKGSLNLFRSCIWWQHYIIYTYIIHVNAS